MAASANAATYYVDFTSGNDSNSGTSKSTPWKRHPYMADWSGRYNHSAGDQFIFRGGVTWPRSCFQMRIRAGGSSGSVRDYYGVDKSWFNGSGWVRPVFDFEDTQIGTGWNSSAGVWFDSVHYITFDSIELKRHRAPISPSGADWGAATINLFGSASYITIQNCVIRDWTIPMPEPGQDGGGSGGICQVNGAGVGVVVTGCTLHQANTSVKSGFALRVYGEISYCEVYRISNAILGGGKIHHNHIHDVMGATDPMAHENAIYTLVPSKIYNNQVHHLDSQASAIYVSPSFVGQTGYDEIYENVVYAVGYQPPVQIDLEGPNTHLTGSRIYNNVLENSVGICIRVASRNGAVLGLLDAQNNQLITSSSIPICYSHTIARCGAVNTLILKNNQVIAPGPGTIPSVPVSPAPAPVEPAPTQPAPAPTQPAPAPTQPVPTQPAPAPTEPAPTPSGNILANGSFEQGYEGWIFSGNQKVVSHITFDAQRAVLFNYGQLDADGALSRTVSTVAGQRYTLTYNIGAFSLVNRNEQRMQVTITGNGHLASATASVWAPGDGTDWASQTFSFTADSATTKVDFRDVSPTSENIDLLLDGVLVIGD